jgi:AraC-like DNA-binding protein
MYPLIFHLLFYFYSWILTPFPGNHTSSFSFIAYSKDLTSKNQQMYSSDAPVLSSKLKRQLLLVFKQNVLPNRAFKDEQFDYFIILRAGILLLILLFFLFRERDIRQKIYLIERQYAQLSSNMDSLLPPDKPQSGLDKSPLDLSLNPEDNELINPLHNPSIELYNRIIQLIESEKLYLNPELDQKLIAKMLNSNKSYIYAAINANSNLNFKGIINYYRIEESKRLIQKLMLEKKQVDYTLIMQLSGFNSRASFYRIFKMLVGMSPVEYAAKCSSSTQI